MPTAAHPMADDPQVTALVGRAVAGDRAAFADLYERFLTQVYPYVYYRPDNRADAEDVTEQVFLQAWSAIDRFRWQGKPFVAWLFTLAHNLLIGGHRRKQLAHAVSLDDSRF